MARCSFVFKRMTPKEEKSLIAIMLEKPLVEVGGMRIRRAVKDHSDSSWLRSPLPEGEVQMTEQELMEHLDFLREDKKIF